jgi:hypothetical protein
LREFLLACSRWALGLWAFYALGALVFLNTPIFDRVVDLQPDAKVSLGLGWSLIPGRVRVLNARVEGEDLNVHWIVDIGRADVQLHLRDLFRRQFHTRRVLADDVKFRLHVKDAREKERDSAAYGPTWPPGWSRARIALARKDQVAVKRARHWQVRLENVEVTRISRLAVDGIRLEKTETGAVSVQGRLDLYPGVWAEIGPIRMQAAESDFSIGENRLARVESLDQLVYFEPFFTEFRDTAEVVGNLALDSRARGRLLPGPLAGSGVLSIEGPDPARFELDAVVRDGRITDSSRASLRIPLARARLGRWKLEAAGSMEIRGTRVRASLARIELSPARDGRVVARGDQASFAAFPADSLLTRIGSGWNWEAAISGARIVDLDPAAQSMARGFTTLRLAQGEATLDAEASSFKPGRLNLQVKQVSGVMRGKPFDGRGSLTGKLGKTSLSPLSSSLDGSLLELSSGDWWARSEISAASVTLGPRGTVARGDVRIALKDSAPILDLYSLDRKIPVLARRLLDRKEVTGSSAIEVREEEVRFQELKLRAGSVRVAGELLIDGETEPARRQGRFVMHLGLLPIGIRLDQADAQVKVFPSEEWLASGL